VRQLIDAEKGEGGAKSRFLRHLQATHPHFTPNAKGEKREACQSYDVAMKAYNRFHAWLRDESKRENGAKDGKERSDDAIVASFISSLRNRGYDNDMILLMVEKSL
jgi:hypothetical protein